MRSPIPVTYVELGWRRNGRYKITSSHNIQVKLVPDRSSCFKLVWSNTFLFDQTLFPLILASDTIKIVRSTWKHLKIPHELCHAKTGSLILVVVIPKEGSAATNPVEPSFGMTPTKKCNLWRQQRTILWLVSYGMVTTLFLTPFLGWCSSQVKYVLYCRIGYFLWHENFHTVILLPSPAEFNWLHLHQQMLLIS